MDLKFFKYKMLLLAKQAVVKNWFGSSKRNYVINKNSITFKTFFELKKYF